MHLKFQKKQMAKKASSTWGSQAETLNSNNSLKTHNMGTKHSLEEPAHQDLSIDTKFARK